MSKNDKLLLKEKELEIDAYHFSLGRIHDALRPATKMWQKAHNKPLTWPDTVKLIGWLTRKARRGINGK